MKEYAVSFLEASDRETAILFTSLIVAAYGIVFIESLAIALAMGIAMHAIQVVAYEYLAARFNWQRLHIADLFRIHVQPSLMRILNKVQRA